MSSSDPFFGEPFIDVDEWRDEPVRHRHIHGGFEGTDTRFSLWFPPPERYESRMLHFLESQYGGSEYAAFNGWSMDDLFAHGGFVAESNQGHLGLDLSGAKGDPTIVAWRASAETARYAKQLAAEMYGAAPHHSYIYGGSGGGFRCINCLEHTDGVWDAGLAWIMGLPSSVQSGMALYLNAIRVLGDKLPQVDDALDAGGGNPFEGLKTEQRRALADLFRNGYPRETLTVGYQSQAALGWAFFGADVEYLSDFWSVPGYLGADHPEQFEKDLVDFPARVGRVLNQSEVVNYRAPRKTWDRYGMGDAAQYVVAVSTGFDSAAPGLVLEGEHDLTRLGCASIRITSGAGAGRELRVLSVIGDLLVVGAMGGDAAHLLNDVQPGDELRIDNRGFLAFCHYNRYRTDPSVSSYEETVVDGWPIYPQRPHPELNWFAAPFTYDIGIKKLFIINNLGDRSAWPIGAVTYRDQLALHANGDLNDQFRLWFLEHAMHGAVSQTARATQTPMHTSFIDYEGHIEHALRDLIDWVEFDKEPVPSTNFDFVTGGVHLADSADDRGGLQPVVHVTANGAARTAVQAGEEVQFEVVVEAPANTGCIVMAEWDFDGSGEFGQRDTSVDGTQGRVHLKTTHAFSEPGTHFVTVRVASHRDGDLQVTFGKMINLGRVRVVVS